MKKVKAWDFGAAKGTGASVVNYDPKAVKVDKKTRLAYSDLKRPAAPPRRGSHGPITPERRLQELNVDKAAALAVAYRLANFADNRTAAIPQDLRAVVAQLIIKVGGDQSLAHAVLAGLHDDHLTELVT